MLLRRRSQGRIERALSASMQPRLTNAFSSSFTHHIIHKASFASLKYVNSRIDIQQRKWVATHHDVTTTVWKYKTEPNGRVCAEESVCVSHELLFLDGIEVW